MHAGPPKKIRCLSIDEMLEMRRQGVTLREIGERLGVSRQRVQRLIGNTRDLLPRQYCPTKEEKLERKRQEMISRFWDKVEISNPDKCWNWHGAINKTTGYGYLSYNAKHISAHKLAYILTNGAVAQGVYVLHNCDNPRCCNPNHLRSGTQQENVADRESRKRSKCRVASPAFYKARNREIVSEYKTTADAPVLAKKYGINPQRIYQIVTRYRHDPTVYADMLAALEGRA